ncbi:MAG: PepSY domain-containing protein [Verrucomicrobiota bacterium]
MKKISLRLAVLAAVSLAAIAFAACHGLSANEKAPAVVGSIRPIGKVKPADLPALAKISFDDARRAALAAVPGAVILGELEVEDGNLQYSFDIVGTDKSVTEVEIDAGDGKVLATDKDEAKKD